MKTITDLHMHSTASDGSDSVPELLEKIKAAGLLTFAVTDHDTIDGALEMQKIVPHTLSYFPGIEFSCITPFGECHILGYRFHPEDDAFREALNTGRQLRRKKLETRLVFLRDQFGIQLTDEELDWLYKQNSPGKPHLGRILVHRGLAPDLSSAIRTYISPCPGQPDRITSEMAVQAILHADGIPVWAHPFGGEGEPRLSKSDFLSRFHHLLSCGIRGMECHYSRYDRAESDQLIQIALKNNLLISGGSDYHGKNKPNITLGKLNAENSAVDSADLTILQAL